MIRDAHSPEFSERWKKETRKQVYRDRGRMFACTIDQGVALWRRFMGPIRVASIDGEWLDRFAAFMRDEGYSAAAIQSTRDRVLFALGQMSPEQAAEIPVDAPLPPEAKAETIDAASPLFEFCERYIAARSLSTGYTQQLRCTVRALAKWAGREPAIGELSYQLVNDFLRGQRDLGMAQETVRGRRRVLLTLWREMSDLQICDEPINRRIMRVSQPALKPQAWSVEQVRQLLEACDRLRGRYCHGISRAKYWRSYVLTAWDSGLRGVDLRLLERSSIDAQGQARIAQHKTAKLVLIQLRPETVAAVDAALSEAKPDCRQFCFPLWATLTQWRRDARVLVDRSGLEGSIGLLRCSSGTAVEAISKGAGCVHLGNTADVFNRHYLDSTKIAAERTLPPALMTKGGC